MRLAIIPARAGSKRIPNKNIKLFLGKPIIAYSIEAAIQSRLFDVVMVSTNSKEIAEIAVEHGAQVPFVRSEKNSDDYATTVDVILEVIEEYNKRGESFDEACCIYATAPFVSPSLLSKGYQLLQSQGFDSVFPVLPFSFPIQRALKMEESGKMKMFSSEHKQTRSQDLTPAFHDSGQFYWFDTRSIVNKRELWTDNSGVIVLSELEAHDIDNPEDWEIAEFKYKLKNNV